MLILTSVYCRSRSTEIYLVFIAGCLVAFGINALNLFLVGNLLSVLSRESWWPTRNRVSRRMAISIMLFPCVLGAWLAMHRIPGTLHFHDLGYHGVVTPYAWFDARLEVLAVLVFAAFFMIRPLRRLLTFRATLWLGRISFPIYLLHFPIMMTFSSTAFAAAMPLGAANASALALALGIVLTLGAATVYERWVDQPAVALAHKLSNPRRDLDPKSPPDRFRLETPRQNIKEVAVRIFRRS